jgi:hypothetical protein
MSRKLLLCLVLLLVAEHAHAGWVTIKNETEQTIVIQEFGGQRGRLIRGRSIRLLPGETYREYQARAGEKQIQIFDSANITMPLAWETLTWPSGDIAYRIRSQGKESVALAAKP